MSITLVIGGIRSGKSAHAERLAAASGLPVRYVATADSDDPSMAERIEAHIARRPAEWETVHAPQELADAFVGAEGRCVLLDGLGGWIAAYLEGHEHIVRWGAEAVAAAERAGAAVIVAEQAGEGMIPMNAVARKWLDLLGEVTQMFAAPATRVDLVVAGKPVTISGEGTGVGDCRSPGVRPQGELPPHTEGLRRHGDADVRPGDADHAVNVVAGGPPEWLRPALREALETGAERYPDERAATAALAARHGRTPNEIVPTNGAAEALWLLAPALRPRLAACVHPLFGEAEAALRAHGTPVARVLRDPGADFTLDPAAVPDAADLVIVANPASPSATLAPAEALLALRRPGRTVVVDEAFIDLVPGEAGTLAGEGLPDVIVIRSLTKALGIPGLRAGYAIAPDPLAGALRSVRPPWAANALALAALRAAAEHPAELAAIAERAVAERDDLAGRLAAIGGVRIWPGVANFVLVEVPDGPAVVARLRERSIAVRPAGTFPGLGDDHLRLTARDPAANARLADALAEVLAG